MKLIVGLGNEGKEYDNTRHNIGFMLLDHIIGSANFKKSKYGQIYKHNNVIFIKPNTYMNNSGISVSYYIKYYKIDLNDILIIQDDLDLNLGQYRFKYNSGHGGHNGIKSITQYLKTKEYLRLKIGIKTEYSVNDSKFVLQKFNKKEILKLNDYKDELVNSVQEFINGKDYLYLTNKYNYNEKNI